MKRRFAYSLGDNYKKIYINDEMFKGYVCDLKLNNIDKPLIVLMEKIIYALEIMDMNG